jgi:hypothetical protein
MSCPSLSTVLSFPNLPADVVGAIAGQLSGDPIIKVSKGVRDAILGSDTYWKNKLCTEHNIQFDTMHELYLAMKQQTESVTFEIVDKREDWYNELPVNNWPRR